MLPPEQDSLRATPLCGSWPARRQSASGPRAVPRGAGAAETVRRFQVRMRWVSSTLRKPLPCAGFFRIQRDLDWVSLIKSSPQMPR